MSEWKLPPKAKIYEALSAVADARVSVLGPTRAQVTSSEGDKVYEVEWNEPLRAIASNDNASYWQGYLGYPIVASLLAIHCIEYDPVVAGSLAGIPWKSLNSEYKRDYDAVVSKVLSDVDARGGSQSIVVGHVDSIYDQLAALHLQRLPQRKPPPK